MGTCLGRSDVQTEMGSLILLYVYQRSNATDALDRTFFRGVRGFVWPGLGYLLRVRTSVYLHVVSVERAGSAECSEGY